MVAERLTLEEMSHRYDGEWVLIGEPEFDEEGKPSSGVILAHNKDPDEMYREDVRIKPIYAAYWSFVPWPKDLVTAL